MRQILGENKLKNLRKVGNHEEDILNNNTKREEGNFIWEH
jgi:hypothetical protein